jgi:hypothetical protein
MPVIGASASHGISARLKPVLTGGTLSSDATYFYRTFTANGTLAGAGVTNTGGGGGGGGANTNTAYAGGFNGGNGGSGIVIVRYLRTAV